MTSIKISSTKKLEILLKGNYFIVGLGFLVIGGVFAALLIPKGDFMSLQYLNEDLSRTRAIVYNIEKTNCSTNDKRIFEYQFRFLNNGNSQVGSSFSHNSSLQINDTADVEFVSNNIELSRIRGMGNAPYEIYVALFAITFPLLGFTLVLIDLIKLFNCILVLKNFSVTNGILKSKKITSSEYGERSWYKFQYIYKYHDKKYVNTLHSSYPKKYIKTESLVYSNTAPHRSVLLKVLPESLQSEIQKKSI